VSRARAGLAAILLLAAGLRLWGLGGDLPYVFHPDEPGYLRASQRMALTGEMNPHTFAYGNLFFTVHAAAQAALYAGGRLLGTVRVSRSWPDGW
jgi:hypothetical protein